MKANIIFISLLAFLLSSCDNSTKYSPYGKDFERLKRPLKTTDYKCVNEETNEVMMNNSTNPPRPSCKSNYKIKKCDGTLTDITKDLNLSIIASREKEYSVKADYKRFGALNKNGIPMLLKPYRLGIREVSWERWKEVLDWAKSNGYTFANEGRALPNYPKFASLSETGRPVTHINYKDAIVWTNACTQKYIGECACVYRDSNGNIIKDANFNINELTQETNQTIPGIRLPTLAEHDTSYGTFFNPNKYYHELNNTNSLKDSNGKVIAIAFEPIGKNGSSTRISNAGEWLFDGNKSLPNTRYVSGWTKDNNLTIDYHSETLDDIHNGFIGLRIARSVKIIE